MLELTSNQGWDQKGNYSLMPKIFLINISHQYAGKWFFKKNFLFKFKTYWIYVDLRKRLALWLPSESARYRIGVRELKYVRVIVFIFWSFTCCSSLSRKFWMLRDNIKRKTLHPACVLCKTIIFPFKDHIFKLEKHPKFVWLKCETEIRPVSHEFSDTFLVM